MFAKKYELISTKRRSSKYTYRTREGKAQVKHWVLVSPRTGFLLRNLFVYSIELVVKWFRWDDELGAPVFFSLGSWIVALFNNPWAVSSTPMCECVKYLKKLLERRSTRIIPTYLWIVFLFILWLKIKCVLLSYL